MTEDARSRWDDRYSTEGFVWGVEPSRLVAEVAADLPPGRALDLGCGQAEFLELASERGLEGMGLDRQPNNARACRDGGRAVLVADLGRSLPFRDASLDGASLIEVIERPTSEANLSTAPQTWARCSMSVPEPMCT